MKVCIAEKPNVAREIASVIGANKRMDGYFEGNGYQVTWTFGHLCTLKEPQDYSEKWKYWDLIFLPILPAKFGIKLIDDTGIKRQFQVINQLLDSADEVINCGDAGQEGELIQRWVLSKAKSSKPLKRLWISSLTEEAIKEGFLKLREGKDFENLYAAGSARAIGDWLLGINATRLYTLKYGQNKQVLSIGRVQTPTLSMIVKRQLEIDQFKPEPYWELKTKYRDVFFSVSSGRFENQENARAKLNEIANYEFTIISTETKPGSEAPPRLFDLTSLQVECNKKFGFTAEMTLKIIQSLYEKKLTTYPRVDTTYLPEDLFNKVPGILSRLSAYQEIVKPVLDQKIKKTTKIFDDKKITDHHAIIPTGVSAENLSRDERLVFDLVTRRFISAFYPDCKIASTVVIGEANQVEFKANGKQILDSGWRAVYKEDSEKDSKSEEVLPLFTPGEHGKHEPQLSEKMTQPPKHFTDATLLRAMETAGKNVDNDELRDLLKENGIGRPSTRANIIETLFKRKYIHREKKKIIANQIGIDLISVVENELLKSAELTGQWEKKLREIESGKYEIKSFMDELKEMVCDIVVQVKNSSVKKINMPAEVKTEPSSKIESQEDKKLSCPKCDKGIMMKGKNAWGCSEYRNGCQFRIPFEFLGKKIGENLLKELCTKQKTGKIKGFSIDNELVNGWILLDDQFKLQFLKEEPKDLRCPRCKEGIILKGKTSWGCSGYRQGCQLRIPFKFLEKTITRTQMEQLVTKGKTSKINGFLLEDGTKKEGALVFDSQWQVILG